MLFVSTCRKESIDMGYSDNENKEIKKICDINKIIISTNQVDRENITSKKIRNPEKFDTSTHRTLRSFTQIDHNP